MALQLNEDAVMYFLLQILSKHYMFQQNNIIHYPYSISKNYLEILQMLNHYFKNI